MFTQSPVSSASVFHANADQDNPLELFHRQLSDLLYPESEPGVFKREFDAEELAKAGICIDLWISQVAALRKLIDQDN